MHAINIQASAHHLIRISKLCWERFILTGDVWAASPLSFPVVMSSTWCRRMMTSGEAGRKKSASDLFGKRIADDEVTEGLIHQHCPSWIPPSQQIINIQNVYWLCCDALMTAACRGASFSPFIYFHISISWPVSFSIWKKLKAVVYCPLIILWPFLLAAQLTVSVFFLQRATIQKQQNRRYSIMVISISWAICSKLLASHDVTWFKHFWRAFHRLCYKADSSEMTANEKTERGGEFQVSNTVYWLFFN